MRSLMKKSEKAYDVYNNKVYKLDCYCCEKRGNPIEMLMKDVHKKCSSCKVWPKIKPYYEDALKSDKKLEDFIADEYGAAVYKFLAKLNPMMNGPKGVKKRFLEFFKGPYNKFPYQTKNAIAFIAEGEGAYHIIK